MDRFADTMAETAKRRESRPAQWADGPVPPCRTRPRL